MMITIQIYEYEHYGLTSWSPLTDPARYY
jgi:hypothetical protein